jgi:hypothetical protein
MEDEINGKEKAYSGRDRCEASAGRCAGGAGPAGFGCGNLPSGAIFQLNQMAFRVLASTWITPGCVQFLGEEKRFHTAWVKRRNTRGEQITSAVIPTTDIRRVDGERVRRRQPNTIKPPEELPAKLPWDGLGATAGRVIR